MIDKYVNNEYDMKNHKHFNYLYLASGSRKVTMDESIKYSFMFNSV